MAPFKEIKKTVKIETEFIVSKNGKRYLIYEENSEKLLVSDDERL